MTLFKTDGGKMILLGYDEIIENPPTTRECSFCLTLPEAEAVLVLTGYLGWRTRWYSTSGGVIDRDKIQAFQDDLRCRIMAGCGDDNILSQWTSDGMYQHSGDGGVTWYNAPDDDPRNGITFPPPLAGNDGSEKRCQAANAGAGWFKRWVDLITEGKNNDAKYADLVAVCVGVIVALGFVVVGWVILLLGAAIALIYANYDATTWSGSFDNDFWQSLVDALYCNLDENGMMTTAGYQSFLVDLAVITEPGARHFVFDLAKSIRRDGINAACRQVGFATSFQCGACDCDFNDWYPSDASSGIIISQNTQAITLQAQQKGDGNYYIIIESPSNNECCCVMITDVVAAHSPQHSAWWYCGVDASAAPSSSGGDIGTNTSVRKILLRNGGAFTCTITRVGCIA